MLESALGGFEWKEDEGFFAWDLLKASPPQTSSRLRQLQSNENESKVMKASNSFEGIYKAELPKTGKLEILVGNRGMTGRQSKLLI